MARGYPDWFGQSIFPWYGGTSEINSGLMTIPAETTKTLVTIEGKGVMYNIEIWIDTPTHHPTDGAELYIDNVQISDAHLATTRKRGKNIPTLGEFYITLYDVDDFEYTMMMSGLIPFSQKIELKWSNDHADDALVRGKITHSRVT